MNIRLTNAGKRFNREWIFRGLNQEFSNNRAYAITGPNGSGKSTLLQLIAGATPISEGKIEYSINGKALSDDQVYQHMSLAAPYLETIEEMTLKEFLQFHESFKPWLPGHSLSVIAERVGLKKALDKQIRFFSSGMKQRVKLAQAFFTDTHVLLLDEPCTNLDVEGIRLYRELIRECRTNRLLVISSNDPQEFDFCDEVLSILDYKKS